MKSHRLFIPQSMIPAMVSGAKTQHRVPVKRKLGKGEYIAYSSVLGWNIYRGDPLNGDREPIECPYQPGDEVWFPETWMPHRWHEGKYHARIGVRYLDNVRVENPRAKWTIEGACRWRSPATMPRWAARIVRTVKAVRVERVQDISEADAAAESARYVIDRAIGNNWCSREAFAHYWDATHGPGAWDRNDFCWVLNFEEAK